MSIAVITPTLPERKASLDRACHSVVMQTRPPERHLIGYDRDHNGGSPIRNQLCVETSAEWIAPLDDDDYLLPRHLEALEAASDGADVVYSRCVITGRSDWNPSGPFDADKLRRENYIPVTALIRRTLVLEIGGWKVGSECVHGYSDWDFWLRALDADARFKFVDELTWAYCFHEGSQTIRWLKENDE